MEKAQLRSRLRNCLDSIAPESRVNKSEQVCQRLVNTCAFHDASTVMMYLALDYEADTEPALRRAWHLGKTVVVPKVLWAEAFMVPVQIDSLEDDFSVENAVGLRNPRSDTRVPAEQIDLVVVPGLGFDEQGHRLGHGGGYYDRFFADARLRATRCGFGFTEQIVEAVPFNEKDQSVDLIVTDQRTYVMTT